MRGRCAWKVLLAASVLIGAAGSVSAQQIGPRVGAVGTTASSGVDTSRESLGSKLPLSACPDGFFTYPADLVLDPVEQAVVWRPGVCRIYESLSFSIEPALAPTSGLAFDPANGVVSAARFAANRSDHTHAELQFPPSRPRTVSLQARNRLTGRVETLTADFSYRFRDSAPLRIQSRYQNLAWEPFMGEQVVRGVMVVGGAGGYRYRLASDTPLPAGYALDGRTGSITGAPSSRAGDDPSYVKVVISDSRGRRVQNGLFFSVVEPALARGPADRCFIFVHGHRDIFATGNPAHEAAARLFGRSTIDAAQHARAYWNGRNSSAQHDREDLTRGLVGGRLFVNSSRDMIDIVTNNETDRSGVRWLATGRPIDPAFPRHRYAVVSYDAFLPYWEAADEVAAQLRDITAGRPDLLGNVCDPAAVHAYIVVAHSMGGVVTTYINGNSQGQGSNPRWRRAYQEAMERVALVVTIQSPLQGTDMSDLICRSRDNDNGLDELLTALPNCGFSDALLLPTRCAQRKFACDKGTDSLRTGADVRLKERLPAGRLARPTYVGASHVGITVGAGITSNGSFFGYHPFSSDVLENDGVVPIRSAWGCDESTFIDYNNNPDRGRHHFGPCRSDQTIRPGLIPFIMTNETHDDGRNGQLRGTVANPCVYLAHFFNERIANHRWDTLGCINSSIAESVPEPVRLNSAQAIRCAFGADPAAPLEAGRDYICPAGLNQMPAVAPFVEAAR